MKEIMCLFILILILISGCSVYDSPFITSVKVEPSTLTVGGTPEQATLTYHIKNPFKFGFNGKIKILYEKDCLTIWQDELKHISKVKYNLNKFLSDG